ERTFELKEANKHLIIEIEEHEQTEEALKKEHGFLNAVLNNIEDGIVACNNEGILNLFNRATREFHDLPDKPIPADQWAQYYDLYLPDGKTQMKTEDIPLFRALQGEPVHNVEMVIASKDGKARTLLASGQSLIDSRGNKTGAVVSMHDITERKQAEEALRESEEKFRHLYRNTPVMLHSIDSQERLLSVSNHWLEVMGYKRDEVIGLKITGFLTEASKKYAIEVVLPDFFKNGYCKEVPYQVIKKNGEAIDVLLSAISEKDDSGKVIRSLAVLVDVTERKRAEEALQKNKARYQELFNEAPVGYHEIDSDGRITRVNQTELDMLGYSAEEMLGSPIWKFIVAEEEVPRKTIAGMISGAISPDTTIELTRKRKDGTMVSTLGTARLLKDEQGHSTGLRVTVQDISDKKRIEDQLLKSKTMLQAVFDGISEPLIMLDKDKKVKMLNRPATQYYNIEYQEAVGNFCFKAFKARSEQCEDCRIPSGVPAGEPVIYERKGYKDPDRIEKMVIYPVREKERKTGGAIIRINDITEEKKMERELIQADKMISLGVLVSGVAHEINNPNNFIMLNTPLLLEAWEAVVPILEKYYEENGDFSMAGLSYSEMRGEVPILFKGIEDGSSRIKHIVEDLKDYSRQDIAEMDQTVDLNKVIETALSLVGNLIKRSTRKFRLNCQKNLPLIKGNLQKLEQVVINLIQNACHALSGTEEGIFVTASFDEEKDGVVIEVRDEGRGIPDELLPRIMDPFFTTKRDQGGTGLGLSVSSKIVKEHGGTIDVKSERGKGSTFKIFLPVKRKEKLVKILVADDEDTIREFLTTVLRENQGYSVREASTGTEACVKLGSDRPDLLILDVIMPDMNGVEVCRLIRKEPELSGIRIIVITGFPDSPEVKEIADMGFNNILSKADVF
ncbi:MAG: PAS domain S-box protein, partial [Deltaproteobacteria bacterium]|nr:PAS domain S-box protein [Deltaproteobacteria bacterium]